MSKLQSFVKFLFFFLSFQLTCSFLKAQDVTWANKLLEYADKYQFENNYAELVLGPPTVYPAVNLHDKHDPYSEGYIINYINSRKSNVISVGFPKIVNANQIVVGGIFNAGSIEAIYIIQKDGKEKQVYRYDKEPTKTKFKSFSTFIPYGTVYGVKILIDHSKINDWNIIKGIGVLNSDKLFQVAPALIEDTTHHHTKEVVGENINSADCFEFSPKIAPDGKTLYFVKECKDQPDQDIWFSELDTTTGKWSDAKNIGVPLNNKGHNFVASISPDGNKLLIGNRYKEDGSDGGDGVSMSTKLEDGKWSIPKSIDIPDYINLNEHANFFMGPENNVLLMAIEDSRSLGELDLYVSLLNKTTNKWSAPINLGSKINTPFSEDYPFLAHDGVTLYFSSKGYTGYGGHDIYMSKRLDDTWKNWSKPLNLGPFVNTKSDDKGFVVANHGDHAYFNSASINSDLHHMDIFKVDLPKMLQQEPRILVSGILTSAKDGKPLRGTVTVKEEVGQVASFCSSNPKTGKYVLSVPSGKVYDIIAEAIDHYVQSEKLLLNDPSLGVELTRNFVFEPFMDTGMVYKMQNILFEYKSSTLLEQSSLELDRIAEHIKQQAKATFEIAGHTDSVGSDAFNMKLSQERARSVMNYLVSKGIKVARLTAKGYGKTKPVASNETEEGRSFNRRVELTVIKKDVTPVRPKPNTVIKPRPIKDARNTMVKKKRKR